MADQGGSEASGGEARSTGRRLVAALYSRMAIDGFFNGLTSQYNMVYIVELGYSEAIVGRIRSFSLAAGALPAALLGMAADTWSRRKAYLLVLLLEAVASVFYYVDGSIYALMLADLSLITSFYALMAVESILLADYVRGQRRGLAFGVANSVNILASMLAPVAAAYLINMWGGISAQAIRPLYLLRLAGLGAGILLAYHYIVDVRTPKRAPLGKAFRESVELLKLNPWLKRWVLLEVLGGYVWSISVPFEMIFAVRVKGADEFVLGAMGAALNIGAVLASPLAGRLADRIGRVKTLLLLRPLYYASVALLVLAPSPEYLVAAWFIRGVFSSGSSAFRTLALELVPHYYRGRWAATRNLVSMLLRSPAPLLGGLLYTMVSPAAPFAVAVAVDALLRVPLLYMTPETRDRRRYLAMFREPGAR